ncbi:Mucin-associated surface protein (MASP), subgroup S085 [Trypanosoma cruzi]|nr:Mucin-associated surface protein (MASP), subgroup S085 [Trypanosoma cruzi]
MAMVMTGRALLVCALCVLWCGACGVYARELDSNGLDGSVSSGVLGANWPHIPSGSDKNAVMLPPRSVLPITVAEALNENDVSVTTEEDADLSLNAGSLHAAANRGAGRIGNTIDSHAGGSKYSGGEIGSPVAGAVGVQGEGAQRSGGGVDPNGSGHSTLETLGREASEKGGDQSGVRREENSRNPPAELSPSVHSKPPITPPEPAAAPQIQHAPQVLPQKTPQTAEASPPAVSAEDRGTPESRDSQISSEETKKHSNSETKTESQVKEKFSNGGLTEEEGQEATTPNLAKNAVTDTPTKTTAPSLSTSGTGDVQTTTDTVDNGAQRPNIKEPQEGLEDNNTKVPPRASGAAPQTALTATITQTNHTMTPGDSDSSNAVSHTTSPLLLLLLVVACAAAAAVVAA